MANTVHCLLTALLSNDVSSDIARVIFISLYEVTRLFHFMHSAFCILLVTDNLLSEGLSKLPFILSTQ